MRKSLAGTRIREARRKAGITQKALAEAAGVSASYLNLIEHNRRAVAGRVMLGIARALNVPPASLADGVGSALVGDMHEAAAHGTDTSAEIDAIDELVNRFPGWSRLLTTLYRQSRDQEATIAALSDRLTHDPFLAESLHSMLSNITAIRSTANILKSIDDIESAQQSRFHTIIHEESRRLTDAAQALVTYFDNTTEQGNGSATPEEELDGFLIRNGYVFPEIDLATKDASQIIDDDPGLKNAESNALAHAYLDNYAKDAVQMPLAEFASAALAAAYDPGQLAAQFKTDLCAVFRRFSQLNRDGISAPPMGLIVVNAAGQALFRRPLQDFALPRHGSACARWPLFRAFSQPERPISTLLELPGGQRFICLSVAQAKPTIDFGAALEYQASMLILPAEHKDLIDGWLPPTGPAEKIGITCRICPRSACPTRAEPQILANASTQS